METYLRDDSFQLNKPKILLWEMPERDMRMPPDYKYRARRYQSDNTEWLLRASSWVQNTCSPSSAIAKIEAGGEFALGVDGVISKSNTSTDDYFEISFSRPLDKLDYLAANISLLSSNKVILEAIGNSGERRKFEMPFVGDGVAHKLRTPIPSKGEGFTKVRIFPGRGTEFTFKDLQICRQPDDLLK
jgi:alginate O-acetyltransferase complex protein AlgJ